MVRLLGYTNHHFLGGFNLPSVGETGGGGRESPESLLFSKGGQLLEHLKPEFRSGSLKKNSKGIHTVDGSEIWQTTQHV